MLIMLGLLLIVLGLVLIIVLGNILRTAFR
jgi:hypothetical protein